MLITELLPLIVGAAVLPLWIIIALLLLRSEGGTSKAFAFAVGAMAVRVLQGILFGFVFGAAAGGWHSVAGHRLQEVAQGRRP
jgi:hypothetical protein